MNNSFLDSLKRETNYTKTENGGVAHKSTLNAVYDMFALGGAYRNRTDEDCILLFKNALEENEELALKCLFYLRDVRGGQGERRFFRVCFKWLAKEYPDIAARNLENVPEYGRWDDLYSVVGTKIEEAMFAEIINQLDLDMEALNMGDSFGVSLLAKWLKSENASSKETKKLGDLTRKALGLSHKQYRKILSDLRTRINIVEKLMSEGKWEQIEYAKLPSKAGLIYRNAFARRDAERYEEFINNKETKVNAGTLYPYDIVNKVTDKISYWGRDIDITDTEREVLNKYWANQKDYLNGQPCKIMCIVDTSGSMTSRYNATVTPIDVAISLGMYCGERIGEPFKNYFISFSSRPQLIKIEGIDFVDKVARIYRQNLCEDTNLNAVFDLLLKMYKNNQVKAEDLPEQLIVISDMEINNGSCWYSDEERTTEMQRIRNEWEAAGVKMPKLVYWNVNARHDLILDDANNDDVTFVSGMSASIFESVITGKSGKDIMIDKLVNSGRYANVK